MADNKKNFKDFPKKQAPDKIEKVEPFNTRKHDEQLAKKPEADALKEKSRELAKRYPLNPGGVSSDIDAKDKPERAKEEKLDRSKNLGGVHNPRN